MSKASRLGGLPHLAIHLSVGVRYNLPTEARFFLGDPVARSMKNASLSPVEEGTQSPSAFKALYPPREKVPVILVEHFPLLGQSIEEMDG